MKKRLKKCPVCGAVMYQFAPGIRCLDCEMKQAQDERERNRVKTLAWAAYHLEHGERLSLGYGHELRRIQFTVVPAETQCSNKLTLHSIIFAFYNAMWYTEHSRRLIAPSGS